MEKGLLFRTTTSKGNPEGRSALRNAYRAWWLKKRIEEIEGIGIERDLAGIPKIGVPQELLAPDAPPHLQASLDVFKEMGENIRNDEQACIIYPLVFDENGNERYRIELMSAAGSKQHDTSVVIERYARQIAMTVLADVILLGHEKVGSFALAESKADLLTSALEAWIEEICSVLNSHAVPRLFKLNGESLEYLPKITHGELGTIDIKALSETVSNLAGAGMRLFPDDQLENYIRDQAGWPEGDFEEQLPPQPAPPPPPQPIIAPPPEAAPAT